MTIIYKELENFNLNDLPKNEKIKETTYKQYIPNEEDFINSFGETDNLEDIWDKMHVFIQENIDTNRRLLLIGPVIVSLIPQKFLGITLKKIDVLTKIERIIEISEKIEIDQDEEELIKQTFMENIKSGQIPWSESLNAGILIQNDINRVYNDVANIIPDVHKNKISVEPLSKIFNELYTRT